MAKDKLITVRIESEKREDFTKWAKDRSIDASVFLYGVIDACLDGRIDERILNNRVDDKQLDKLIDERLDNKLDSLVSEAVRKAIAPFEKKLEEFDKGFQSWGAVVHDHDQMLSESVASKDELHKAVNSLKNEIESIKKF